MSFRNRYINKTEKCVPACMRVVRRQGLCAICGLLSFLFYYKKPFHVKILGETSPYVLNTAERNRTWVFSPQIEQCIDMNHAVHFVKEACSFTSRESLGKC